MTMTLQTESPDRPAAPDGPVPAEATEVPAGEPKEMYGTFSGISLGLVALIALMVIALAVFASPLLAVGIVLAAAVFLLIGMSALRQRSERQDRTAGGAPASGEG